MIEYRHITHDPWLVFITAFVIFVACRVKVRTGYDQVVLWTLDRNVSQYGKDLVDHEARCLIARAAHDRRQEDRRQNKRRANGE